MIGLLTLASALMAGEDQAYDEALLFVDWQARKAVLQCLDGTTIESTLPLAAGYHIPGAWALSVTPWGKMVYFGSHGGFAPPDAPLRVSEDDGRAPVLWVGFWSNTLRDLLPMQVALSNDGRSLAVVATQRGDARSRPALFCMDMGTGETSQVTSWDNVATSPRWSSDGKSVAFFLGKEPDVPFEENRLALHIAEAPLRATPRVRPAAPPALPPGLFGGAPAPVWADADNVIYFEQRLRIGERPPTRALLHRLDLRTGELEDLGHAVGPAADEAGRLVVFYAYAPLREGDLDEGWHIAGPDHTARPVRLALENVSALAISPSGGYLYCAIRPGPAGHVIERRTGTVVLAPKAGPGVAHWIRVWRPRGPALEERGGLEPRVD